MTPRVPLVCTPEDFRAFAWALTDYVRTLAAGRSAQRATDYARVVAAIDALFRPAEERKEAERNTGFDSRSGATLPSSSGAGMANPVAGGRAPGQDALSSAPAAPPPAGEPAWMTPELRKNLDCMVFVDAQVFSQARASMVAAIDHAVLSALAAIRAENERYAAVLRLCAGDVVTCYPTDDGTVKVAVNLNDYFVPASDGEEIEMADAPVLAALYKHGGWPAIYQWVADRRGVPNRHWRLKPPIDSASVPPGENRSEG